MVLCRLCAQRVCVCVCVCVCGQGPIDNIPEDHFHVALHTCITQPTHICNTCTLAHVGHTQQGPCSILDLCSFDIHVATCTHMDKRAIRVNVELFVSSCVWWSQGPTAQTNLGKPSSHTIDTHTHTHTHMRWRDTRLSVGF